MECFICRDKGKEEGCKCGRFSSDVIDAIEIDPLITNKLKIPKHYINLDWSPTVLKDSHKDIEMDHFFNSYIKGCNKIKNKFAKGIVPEASFIIIAPRKFGKMTLAYNCIQLGAKAGLTVAPLLDTLQLKYLLTLSLEKPNSKYLIDFGVGYTEYITCDVVFITVDKSYLRANSFETIDYILDLRSREGKSTFIISRADLAELSAFDYHKRFVSLFDDSPGLNRQRYPWVLKYSILGGI